MFVTKTLSTVKWVTQSPLLWLTKLIQSGLLSFSSQSLSIDSLRYRKSEADVEAEANKPDFSTAERAALMDEVALIRSEMRETIIELRLLLQEYSALRKEGGRSLYDPESHRF